ncbi:MAG TPA: class I SAM-dependent methyltransferase [Candidatus Nanoarchaeia archaeon]|nr:class I SAM-dependent methyltransferase [Candidatus Nanoarchaeia archaeon]
MKTLYGSSERYLNGPDGMRNEVDMWYTGASLFLQEVMRKKRPNEFGGLHEESGIEARTELKTISVLDVCCGPGNFANHVGLFYPKLDLTGIDINDEFLESARKRFSTHGRNFLKMNAIDFQLGRTFDFVLASSAYHHIEDEDKRRFLKSIKEHLSKSGKIIICENFLPYYDNDKKLRSDAINRYYKALIAYYARGNATPEAIDVIREVYQLELQGEEEHKVHYQRFKQDVEEEGLVIEVDRIIWQPKDFRADNAGSHVLLLKGS